MSVYEKLMNVQKELKAPKNQYNNFGKYHYRSCEDILEGLKPVLSKYGATLFITDSIELIGDRYYVKATAEFMDIESGESVKNSAFARESIDKKGMDDSQITGATSSYARKYALNGLFLIDDTKDADTDEYQNQQVQRSQNTNPKKSASNPQKSESNPQNDEVANQQMVNSVDRNLIPEANAKVTQAQLDTIKSEMQRTGINMHTILTFAKAKSLEEINQATAVAIINNFAKTPNAGERK